MQALIQQCLNVRLATPWKTAFPESRILWEKDRISFQPAAVVGFGFCGGVVQGVHRIPEWPFLRGLQEVEWGVRST